MNVSRIDSHAQFRDFPYQVKKTKGNYMSNIYPGSRDFSQLIDEGRLFFWEHDGNFFFFEDKGQFYNVFFSAGKDVPVLEILSSSLDIINPDKPLVLEHIIRIGKDASLGKPSAVLKRMVHTDELAMPAPKIGGALPYPYSLRDANPKDVYDILEIFSTYFNPLTERLPDEKELLSLIDRRGVKLSFCNGRLAGFIIFEMEGFYNLHLRYWWTAPGFRGGGIGSGLMHKFIEASRTTKRQHLWVFEDNENAIKRYHHYGFDFDGTQDDIYILAQ